MLLKSLRAKIFLVLLMGIFPTMGAYASHHFQSGLAKQYPAYDLNDAYLFESEREGYTVFILSANPSTRGKGGKSADLTPATTFGKGGLYNMHIATDMDIRTGITLTFMVDGNHLRVGNINNPNAPIGEEGEEIGKGSIGKTFTLSNDIKIWAGRALDPFFGNGVGFPKFHQSIAKGTLSPEAFKNAQDLFTGARASIIVVEIPNTMLTDKVHYYITTAVKDPNHRDEWVQVNREANVLMPYIFLSDTPAVQAEHDQHRPGKDVGHKAAISNNVFRAVVATGVQHDPASYANQTAEILTPDVLTYKVGTKASYDIDTMNGRALADDAMDTILSLYVGKPMVDYVAPTGKYSKTFPYILPVEK